MALTPVADDQVATIVTTLEMRERPRPRPLPDAPLRLVTWKSPDPARYRILFRRVGGPWLWYSRLVMDDARLAAILNDKRIAILAVTDPRGIEVGMLELDFREPHICILQYLGLVPEWTGQGHGRWLMAMAMAHGWRPKVTMMRVNTCTLDHPRALGLYRASGFVPVRRTIETFADPRITGALPADAAPQIPLLARR
ncbi:GNAT family N-acetyltransferase [Sphingomonas sp.]